RARGERRRTARSLPRAARFVQDAEDALRRRHDPEDRNRKASAPAPTGAARPPMKFAVVGAGAIGAYVGAALARGGSEVTLIARGAHLEAMQEHGVRVLSPRGDFQAHPETTDDIESVADADVVFVGLKAYSLPELASRLGEA